MERISCDASWRLSCGFMCSLGQLHTVIVVVMLHFAV